VKVYAVVTNAGLGPRLHALYLRRAGAERHLEEMPSRPHQHAYVVALSAWGRFERRRHTKDGRLRSKFEKEVSLHA
jgi:hypothetical protein